MLIFDIVQISDAVLQQEAERFEKAILTSASESGRQGIVRLPGVQPIIDEVRL